VDRARRDVLQRDLARLADGDREAFHPVFVCLWPLLRGFAGRYLPAPDAEDAAQEALVKVFARAAVFDARRDALSWTLGIAAYEIKTVRRRRQRRREDGEPRVETGDGRADPEALAMARQREEAVQAAFALLDPADAATLRAYASGDPPPVSGATFRKRVQRALARLRLAWRMNHGRP
jgi:DNA-directed RNA polymerase specialized sigma24 family protein